MSVNLYDVLDVDRDASPDQIRTAWKSAIADLEPGDRRFRAYNEAAEVLLDPERRASYDAGLDADRPEQKPTAPASNEAAVAPPAGSAESAEPAEPGEPGVSGKSGGKATEPSRAGAGDRLARLAVPVWLLAGLLALSIVLAGAAVWLIRDQPSDDSVERALRTAEGVAQTAVPTIFSYDYRTLEEDHDKAAAYLTDDYRTEKGGYDDTFESVIQTNAPRLKTVVEAEFLSSGIVRTGGGDQADDRVEVLVVFDQLSTNKQVAEPQRAPAYALVTMENVGGDWLVDDVTGPEVPR